MEPRPQYSIAGNDCQRVAMERPRPKAWRLSKDNPAARRAKRPKLLLGHRGLAAGAIFHGGL